ncbi:MAG: N-acetylneuraminate synthase family protein [Puniceicoccaceae bacterium]
MTFQDVFNGSVSRPLIIAEIAQAHDGSLGMAHSYIDLAAECGVHAIKFQTHFADEESTEREAWRVKFSYEDDRRIDYWRRMEFSEPQWHGLKAHCDEAGLIFLSSAFSERAFQLLLDLGVPAWKVASGELNHTPLLDRMLSTDLPILLSSGMSGWTQLDELLAKIQSAGNPVALFQCTSSYPTPMDQVGLNVISELSERYQVPVGLSDHSGEIYPCLAAQILGARLLEVHLTFDKRMFGPDAKASLEPGQLKELVRASELLAQMMEQPINKDALAQSFVPQMQMFSRSLVATRDLPAGHQLTAEDLCAKKPGGGMEPALYRSLIGRTLVRSRARDEAFEPADFE